MSWPGAPAQAANWLEKQIYMSGAEFDGVLPSCEAALGKIASRFAQKESRFWNSNLQILGFEKVRQTAFSPWASDTIPRRFCSAVALVSDGRKHRVDYWIGEDTGTIGAELGRRMVRRRARPQLGLQSAPARWRVLKRTPLLSRVLQGDIVRTAGQPVGIVARASKASLVFRRRSRSERGVTICSALVSHCFAQRRSSSASNGSSIVSSCSGSPQILAGRTLPVQLRRRESLVV